MHYVTVHKRIAKLLGKPSHCVLCGSIEERRYEWAHVHGTPMEPDPANFFRACVPCHRIYDKTTEGNLRISETLKAKGIVPPSRKGTRMPEEAKRKISQAKLGKSSNNLGYRVLSPAQIGEIQGRFNPSRRGVVGGNVRQLAEEFRVSVVTIREIGKKIGRYSD